LGCRCGVAPVKVFSQNSLQVFELFLVHVGDFGVVPKVRERKLRETGKEKLSRK
jgi:hypothetical protein